MIMGTKPALRLQRKETGPDMDLLASNSQLLLEKSLGFLWTKQAAILDNVANAETPNYKAKVVTFEETIRDRLEQSLTKDLKPGRRTRAALEEAETAVTVSEAQEVTRTDDNGVSVTDQMVELARNAYQTQYVMQCITGNLSLLRMAVRGQ